MQQSHPKYSYALRLIHDGWSPQAIQSKTGLSTDDIKKLFQSEPARASQWGLQPTN